jgi:16S rRNA (guanine527-N7)-methyltransferase
LSRQISQLVGMARAREDLKALQLNLAEPQIQQLLDFAAVLEKWNRHFNLLSRRDIDRLWSRHILDSLSVVNLLCGERVLDLGSGGGFPGLPLAIAQASRSFVLLDRHQRKCRFLEQVVMTLGLDNVTVRCADVADLSASADTGFDTVTSRAVAPAAEVWALVQPLLTPGGRLIVMASTRSEPEALPADARCERRHIPGLERDHELVIIDKQQTDG